MKRSKTPQSNIAITSLPKTGQWIDALCESAFMYYPEKSEWRKRIIHTLFEWLDTSDGIMIEDFCYEYKIPQRTLNKWRKKYPDLDEAVGDAKEFMGARRRKGAILNKFNYQAAYRDMHRYDPSWKSEVDEYHAQIKAQADKNAKQDDEKTKYIVDKMYERATEYHEKTEPTKI